MGCWNETDGVTYLPIYCGDRVKLIFTIGHSPWMLPITGDYDDYGTLENIEENWTTNQIAKEDHRLRFSKAKYEDDLLLRSGVTSVGIGFRQKKQEYTEEVVIVITVKAKYSQIDIADADLLPASLDGVPVDVQEVGNITGQ